MSLSNCFFMARHLRLSKGIRRHIRIQKAMIRRQFGDSAEADVKIQELVRKFFKTNETKARELEVK